PHSRIPSPRCSRHPAVARILRAARARRDHHHHLEKGPREARETSASPTSTCATSLSLGAMATTPSSTTRASSACPEWALR
ncbi:hypothetical protein PMAYCL1PPCAC_13646, partial [Pristionchus mayeri]